MSILYKGTSDLNRKKKSCKICLAGRNILIKCYSESIINMCNDYSAVFDTPDIVINVSKAEIEAAEYEYKNRTQEYSSNKDKVSVIRIRIDMEPFVVHKKIALIMPHYNTFLMHGSVVAKDGYAYMFTALSGVGKTTRTRLWLEKYPDSIVVNGDKPLIRIEDERVIACGTPWCGKEGLNSNNMIPLKAIFLLERVNEREKDSVKEINIASAFPFLLQQTFRSNNTDVNKKIIKLLREMEGKVRFYRFRSAPTIDAVQLAYETVNHDD